MVSEKTGNIASVGGGLLIFFVTVILLGFMTDEYNKGKKYESLKASHDKLKESCLTPLTSSMTTPDDLDQSEDNCKLCKFPFIFQNKSYSDCLKNELTQQFWCPTKLNSLGMFSTGHWTSCPDTKCSGYFCAENITVDNMDDCQSLSHPICGHYSKLYTDSKTLKPYYQKSDLTNVFIHASTNAWFVSDGLNTNFAIALESNECPYDSTKWNVHTQNQWKNDPTFEVLNGQEKSVKVQKESCCEILHVSYDNCLEEYCGIFKFDGATYVNTFDDHIIMIKDDHSKTWRVTHLGEDESAFTYAKMEENQCPEMSTKWFTFETTWNIKDNFHVECIDWPSIFKPILPDCCHTLTVTHPECEKVTGDICGTYKYDSDSLNHSPIYNKDCNDEKFLAFDSIEEKWTFSSNLNFEVSYANSDQKEHCPSDVNIWSVLTTTEWKYDSDFKVECEVYDCCHNLEIQSNNSLCIDVPEVCGQYHLEYIDANQNPVYKNDKGRFLYYDLQGQWCVGKFPHLWNGRLMEIWFLHEYCPESLLHHYYYSEEKGHWFDDKAISINCV